jgi:hypothetical protein
MESSEPRNGSHAGSLHHQFQHTCCCVQIGIVRPQGFRGGGVNKCRMAPQAAVPLNFLPTRVTTFLSTFVTTSLTRHRLDLSAGRADNSLGLLGGSYPLGDCPVASANWRGALVLVRGRGRIRTRVSRWGSSLSRGLGLTTSLHGPIAQNKGAFLRGSNPTKTPLFIGGPRIKLKQNLEHFTVLSFLPSKRKIWFS